MRLRLLHLILIAPSLTLAAPGRVEALIFGVDHRIAVSTEPGSTFGPVGLVYGSPEAVYATAFLVGDCHVLTVQHVFGETRPAVGRKINFAANVSGDRSEWRTTEAVVQASGGLERNVGNRIGIRVSDWALLRLKRCLGREFGHVRLSTRIPARTEPVSLAGYPSDRPMTGGVVIDTPCNIRAVRDLVLLHDCAALPGNSGSPLFQIIEENGNRFLEVFAMSEAAHSTLDLGKDAMEQRDNYPDGVWNAAAPISQRVILLARD